MIWVTAVNDPAPVGVLPRGRAIMESWVVVEGSRTSLEIIAASERWILKQV